MGFTNDIINKYIKSDKQKNTHDLFNINVIEDEVITEK